MSSTVVSKSVYFRTTIALYVLLGATIAANESHLGPYSIVVSIGIAILKAMLVMLFFMHVRYEKSLPRVLAGVGFFWLLLLIAGTVADVVTRGWLAARSG